MHGGTGRWIKCSKNNVDTGNNIIYTVNYKSHIVPLFSGIPSDKQKVNQFLMKKFLVQVKGFFLLIDQSYQILLKAMKLRYKKYNLRA
ncbi:MAG: hypothetical protein ACR5KV_05465 [Wolbachia sp.]